VRAPPLFLIPSCHTSKSGPASCQHACLQPCAGTSHHRCSLCVAGKCAGSVLADATCNISATPSLAGALDLCSVQGVAGGSYSLPDVITGAGACNCTLLEHYEVTAVTAFDRLPEAAAVVVSLFVPLRVLTSYPASCVLLLVCRSAFRGVHL
jgi:hypothetical protein